MKILFPMFCLLAIVSAEPPASTNGHPAARTGHNHQNNQSYGGHDHSAGSKHSHNQGTDFQRSLAQEYGTPNAAVRATQGYESKDLTRASAIRIGFPGISHEYGSPAVRSKPSKTYGALSTRDLKDTYGAPTVRNLSDTYGAPSARTLPDTYGTPSARGHSDSYGSPLARVLSDIYGPPVPRSISEKYGPPIGRLSETYGAPRGLSDTYAVPATHSVSDSYLPISARGSSDTYSPPSSRSLSDSYGPPSARNIADTYGAPAARGISDTYGASAVRGISDTYGAPSARGLSDTYGTPAAKGLSDTYGAPATRGVSDTYLPPSARSLSDTYGVPAARSLPETHGPTSTRISNTHVNPDQRSVHHKHDTHSGSTYETDFRSGSNTHALTDARGAPADEYVVPRGGYASRGVSFNLGRSKEYNVARSVNLVNSFNLPLKSSRANSRSMQTYGTPHLSTQYGAPASRNIELYTKSLSQTYGSPKSRTLGDTYGSPNVRGQEFSVPEQTNAVVSSFNSIRTSPSQKFDTSVREGMLADTYNVPDQYNTMSNLGYAYAPDAQDQLSPQEPANYDFSYKVNDFATGSDFGHSEMRQENHAEGTYFVVLPDGTKQIVEYEADERGFKPKISVLPAEGVSERARGYDANAQSLQRNAGGPY